MRRPLVLLRSSRQAAVRILCFPYAGGHAAFVQGWSRHLPACVELLSVQYPGLDDIPRAHTTRTAQAIAEMLLEDVAQCLDLPLILFGYSLGALIAYELSLGLTQRAAGMPAELVVAASRAPHLRSKKPPLAALPETEFIAKLRELGGTPEAVLQNPELLQHFLPILRTDFATAESYCPTPAAPLSCPITAIGGSLDSMADEAAVAAWGTHTSSAFSMHRVEGGHFFINQCLHSVISIVRQVVQRHVAAEDVL